MSGRTAVMEPSERRGRPALRPALPVRHRLRALRAEYGYTLEELAAEVGTTATTLSQIERGARALTEGMAARVALVFGLPSTEELFVAPIETDSDK